MTDKVPEYVAAALVDIASDYSGGINASVSSIYPLVDRQFNVEVGIDNVDKALGILKKCGIAYIADDPLAGKFVKITKEQFSEFNSRISAEFSSYDEIVAQASDANEGINRAESRDWPYSSLARQHPVLMKYSEFGSAWIRLAMERMGSDKGLLSAAAASDRIVDFSDNQAIVDEIRGQLSQVKSEINSNNEVGDALGDKRDIAAAEIDHLQSMMTAKRARKDILLDYAKRVLGWLSKEIASTSLKEMVKNLTKLFLDWLT